MTTVSRREFLLAASAETVLVGSSNATGAMVSVEWPAHDGKDISGYTFYHRIASAPIPETPPETPPETDRLILSTGRSIEGGILGLGPELQLSGGYDYYFGDEDEDGNWSEGTWGVDEKERGK